MLDRGAIEVRQHVPGQGELDLGGRVLIAVIAVGATIVWGLAMTFHHTT